jgi:hypothetical protein
MAALVCALCLVPVFAETSECRHEWEWVVDTPATADAHGTQHEECKLCGARCNEGTVLHNWQWVVDMPPTRYNPGTKHENCSVCDANRNLNTPIPATEDGYDFGAAMLKAIDSIGNFFHDIIVQIQAIFSNLTA